MLDGQKRDNDHDDAYEINPEIVPEVKPENVLVLCHVLAVLFVANPGTNHQHVVHEDVHHDIVAQLEDRVLVDLVVGILD